MASTAERVDRAVFFTDYMDIKNSHDTYLYENKQDGITKNTIVILRFGGISILSIVPILMPQPCMMNRILHHFQLPFRKTNST